MPVQLQLERTLLVIPAESYHTRTYVWMKYHLQLDLYTSGFTLRKFSLHTIVGIKCKSIMHACFC